MPKSILPVRASHRKRKVVAAAFWGPGHSDFGKGVVLAQPMPPTPLPSLGAQAPGCWSAWEKGVREMMAGDKGRAALSAEHLSGLS